MHGGPVLCVRWTHSGKWLASGSDDTIVMIWDLDPHGGGTVWGSDEKNIEGWKALKRLPGHESDVTDLAWSPNDRYLASVGLDSRVIIWCGYSLEMLRKLDHHQGFVKGVCWDPVGEFLATQSDDKSVKVWRTKDWEVEATVTKPFQDSPGSTFFRRLSWSPDGAHITSSNAMNNNGYVFVAAVIARNEWTSDICLVGHENTVEVAAYNPHIFLRDPGGEMHSTNICSVVALGADDMAVSIWQTKSPRPLLVAKEAFERQIFDLCWSKDGLTLYACSADGTLGVFDFDASELEGLASLEDKEAYLKRFGFQEPEYTPNYPLPVPNAPAYANPQYYTAPAANTTPPVIPEDNRPMIDKKGRRRIKPVFVSHLASGPITGGMAPSSAPPPYIPSAGVPPALQTAAQFAAGVTADSSGQKSAHSYGAEPSSRFATPFRQPDGMDTSMDVPITSWDDNGDYMKGKRKASDMMDVEDAPPTPYMNGRFPKARTLGGDRPREPVGQIRELRPSQHLAYGNVPDASSQGKRPVLAVPTVKTYLSTKYDDKDADVFEANNFDDGRPSEVVFIGGKQTQFLDYLPSAALLMTMTNAFCSVALEDGSIIVYSLTGRRLLPTVILDSPCAFLEGCRSFLMAITSAGTLHVWNTKTQRTSFPPISISPILSPNASIHSVQLRPNGAPLIVLSSGEAYSYDTDLYALVKVGDVRWADGSAAWEGRQRANKAVVSKGVVSSLENSLSELQLQDVKPVQHPNWWETAFTLGHLETRQHAAKILDSPTEFKSAVLLYAKRIADEGFRGKAEELIRDLCGPVYWKPGREETWCPTILGMQKRDILRDVLKEFAKSKTLAKLGQDWQDTLKRIQAES
ncbi:HIR complex subunit [Tulasnella sp. 419]|nr:HIR complex subunit [Tulasnella sp. 419]